MYKVMMDKQNGCTFFLKMMTIRENNTILEKGNAYKKKKNLIGRLSTKKNFSKPKKELMAIKLQIFQ